MSAIKKGDLVMVVRPTTCCGFAAGVGRVFTAGEVLDGLIKCHGCGHIEAQPSVRAGAYWAAEMYRLIKINPPKTGDSLPTRAEKHDEVPA